MSESGRTPLAAQKAMIAEMQELFQGKTYCGQGGSKKALSVFKQDLPIPEQVDDDVDTTAAVAPFIIVRQTASEIKDADSPQMVELELVVCSYDEGKNREGYEDVQNISEAIVQHFCAAPYFGEHFTVQYPISTAIQQDDTHPYYFGDVILGVSTQTMTQDEELEKLL